MKKTLLTTALLIGISGLATASTDGFVVENTVHPEHDGANTSEHTVWIEKVADGKHTYELRIEDGEITVVVDGNEVSDTQIKRDNNAVIVLKDDGGVLYEFKIGPTTDTRHAIFDADGGKDTTFKISRDIEKGDTIYATATIPKVMLGIYSDEASESIRKQLRIKGKAIMVDSVIKGLSADKAGMMDHDIIISIDGSDGVSPEDLTKILGQHNPGDEIKFIVIRNGERVKLGTKLHAYDAKALGHLGTQQAIVVLSTDDIHKASKRSRIFFTPEAQKKTHAKILDALRDQGIDEDKIAEIEAKIIASLDENVWSEFGNGGAMDLRFGADDEYAAREDVEKHRFLVESMQMKAEQAMRDAERMTLEFKDGQLLLKRHTEGLEGKLHILTERLHESMPAIEAELDGRLGELEERLNKLESALDSRMESLTGLIERLIERLDED